VATTPSCAAVVAEAAIVSILASANNTNALTSTRIHPGIKGWLVNSLIVITMDGVVVVEGQMNGVKLVEEVKKLTPQPIKYLIVGSPHGDHGETQMASMPGADKMTFIGHAITKWWFENDANIPNRSGQLPNIVTINEVVGALPDDPKKAPPHVTNKQELINDIRVLEQTYAEGKRLHDAGIPIEDVPRHWHFGENATLFFADAALPDITAIYCELDHKLPACPPCRPRRWQGGGDTAQLPVK
jgi:hypothetical protein